MVIFMSYSPRLELDYPDIHMAFNITSYVFLVIFVFEATAKIISMGKNYFKDAFNTFDFAIIVISIVTLVLTYFELLGAFGDLASVIRVFRLGRVLRLVNKSPNLRMIFNTFKNTLPSLSYIALLLALVQFIYAILGVELFAFVRWGDELHKNTNFRSFYDSMIALFRV